ncbi:MAG: hypothetical protein ACI4QV_03815 [Acutalibacteraceae bacterium]
MKDNKEKGLELPVGFGMALAMNEKAMKKFEAMSDSEKREIIEMTHSINSKREMHQFVDGL